MRKKSPIIALLVVCLLLISMSTTFAASWKYTVASSPIEYYFDTETTRYVTLSDETYIEAWVLSVYKNVKPDGAKTYKEKWFLKLDKKSIAIREHYVYDINGVILSSYTQRGTWQDCIPDSVGERMYDAIKRYVERNN